MTEWAKIFESEKYGQIVVMKSTSTSEDSEIEGDPCVTFITQHELAEIKQDLTCDENKVDTLFDGITLKFLEANICDTWEMLDECIDEAQ